MARLSARGYDDASRLLLYKEKIQSPVIKKTLQVIKLHGDVYQIQQRAFGRPVVQLTKQEIEVIPTQHREAFWQAKHEMDKL